MRYKPAWGAVDHAQRHSAEYGVLIFAWLVGLFCALRMGRYLSAEQCLAAGGLSARAGAVFLSTALHQAVTFGLVLLCSARLWLAPCMLLGAGLGGYWAGLAVPGLLRLSFRGWGVFLCAALPYQLIAQGMLIASAAMLLGQVRACRRVAPGLRGQALFAVRLQCAAVGAFTVALSGVYGWWFAFLLQ